MQILQSEIAQALPPGIKVDWEEFSSRLHVKKAAKREVILRQTEVCDKVIYILEGIAASEYNTDEQHIISRFFQPGNLCTNLVSASTQTLQSDNVIAITNLTYVAIPLDYFMDRYLHDEKIGVFFRKKILQHLIEAKHFISMKTSTSTEGQYAFLETYYPEIIRKTPSKYIAAFIGITPEALSRFLKQRVRS